MWAGNSTIAISSILVALLASSGNPSINKLDTCMELPKKKKISTNLGSQTSHDLFYYVYNYLHTPQSSIGWHSYKNLGGVLFLQSPIKYFFYYSKSDLHFGI